jgi:hypothetical protein
MEEWRIMNYQNLIDIISSLAGKSTLGLILTGSLTVIIVLFYIIFKFSKKPTPAQTQQEGNGSVIDEQNHANNDINNSMEHFKNEKIIK